MVFGRCVAICCLLLNYEVKFSFLKPVDCGILKIITTDCSLRTGHFVGTEPGKFMVHVGVKVVIYFSFGLVLS